MPFSRCLGNATHGQEARIVFRHRDRPPASAEVIAEHTIDGHGSRATGTRADRDELSDRCYQELMANAETRLILAAVAAWPHGRFSHRLYGTHLEAR